MQAVASPSPSMGWPWLGSRSVSTRAGLSHLIEADQGLPPMGLPLHPPQGEERECVEVVAVALGLTDVCAS